MQQCVCVGERAAEPQPSSAADRPAGSSRRLFCRVVVVGHCNVRPLLVGVVIYWFWLKGRAALFLSLRLTVPTRGSCLPIG